MRPPEASTVNVRSALSNLRPAVRVIVIFAVASGAIAASPIYPTSTDIGLSPCSQLNQEANSAQNEGTTTSMYFPPSGGAFYVTRDWTDIKYIFDEPHVQKAEDGMHTTAASHLSMSKAHSSPGRPFWDDRPGGIFSFVVGMLFFFVGISALSYSSVQFLGPSTSVGSGAELMDMASLPFSPWVPPRDVESAGEEHSVKRLPIRQVRDSDTQTLLSFHPDGGSAEESEGSVDSLDGSSFGTSDSETSVATATATATIRQKQNTLPSEPASAGEDMESAEAESHAKPLAKALKKMAASIMSATADVNAWAEEVKQALQRPHSVETETFFASDRLMAALRHMQGNALEAIQFIARDLHRAALLVEKLTQQASKNAHSPAVTAAVTTTLSDVRRVVDTAGQSQFVVACMWNELMAAAGTVERETFSIAVEEVSLVSLARRMSRPLPSHLLEETDTREFHEYFRKEEHLVREMSNVARKYSPTLSRGSMVEKMNKAVEDQHVFLNIIRSLRSGGSPTGFPSSEELRKEAASFKASVVHAGQYFLQILPQIFQNAARERGALSFLIPPSASAGATWANSPLHRLSDILRTGVNTVMQSLEEEERRLYASATDGISKTTKL